MKRQTRIALAVVALALLAGFAALRMHDAALTTRIASNGASSSESSSDVNAAAKSADGGAP